MVRGFRARTACAALLMLATLAWLVVTPTPRAHAQEPDLVIALEDITPAVTAETKTISARGRITNTGKVPLHDVKASLWIGSDPMNSRDALAETGNTSDLTDIPGHRVTLPDSLVSDVTGTLRPGREAAFSVDVPVEQLIESYGFEGTGTYVVGVDIRGNETETGIRHTWRERTFLPWLANAGGKTEKTTPVEVAYLLPLTGKSTMLDSQTLLDTRQANVFAPEGRLSRLLDIGAEYGLIYLADPAIIALAETMQNGYQIASDPPDSDARHHEGSEAAGVFLDKARGLLGAGDTLMLPYGDPDLPALQQNDLTAHYSTAISAAKATARELGVPETDVSWPGDGFANGPMLETVTQSRGSTVLLDRNALPELTTDVDPVVSLATAEGSLTGLVTDPMLLAGGPGGGGSSLQVRQRLLAETSLVAMRDGPPNEDSRRMIATLPRYWDGSGAKELFGTLTNGQIPWLRQLPAGGLLTQSPTAYGGTLNYPASQSEHELDSKAVGLLDDLQAESKTYLDLLADPGRSRPELAKGFLRGASVSWRRGQDRQAELVSEMTDTLETATTEGVTILPLRAVTLTENRGRFPITVANNLPETIVVDLEVEASDRDGLRIESIDPDPVEIPRWRKATVRVTANAVEAGETFRVTAQLRTKDDNEPIGQNVSFDVRFTGYGQIGWGIIGAGVGLLGLAMVVRVFRRLKGRRPEGGRLEGRPADLPGSPDRDKGPG